MNFLIANTLEEYEKIVEPFRKDNWFRGHSKAEYRLEPNIYRERHFRRNLIGYDTRSVTRPQSGYYDIYQYKIADDITKLKYPKCSFIKRMYKCQLPIFRTGLKYTKSPCSHQPILHWSEVV